MKSVAGPRLRVFVAVVGVAAFVLGTTATQRMRQPARRKSSVPNEPPTLTMHTQRLAADGDTCGSSWTASDEVKTEKGRVPDHARPIVELVVVADRPVPLSFFERALEERSKKHCGAGVSMTQAIAADDPRRFVEVTAVVWDRQVVVPTTSRHRTEDGGTHPTSPVDDDSVPSAPVPTAPLPTAQPAPF